MTLPEETRFQITFQAADCLAKEQEQEINTLDHLAFSGSGEEDNYIEWAMSSTWYALGWLDGRLVSQIGILDRAIRAGGQMLSIAGVGGVATHPEFQRRGFAGVLLQAAVEQMRQRGGYDFAMLFCDTRMITYYTKRGYRLVHNPLYILQSGRRVLFESDKMVLPLSGKPWPEGEVDVNGPPW
ncbi:MAG: GNAT family N-acetyltransferase [Anaerolineaceae bacterium]|jgi:GNAT superfamily N-acetyltransferase